MSEINIFKRHQIVAEELDSLTESLRSKIKGLSESYQRTGNVVQSKRYNYDTHSYDLLWEDDEKTIPLMEDEYDYLPITDDELSEEQLLRKEVCKTILVELEKMLKKI